MSKSENIHVIELAAYEKPVVKETSKNDWIEYGEDNNYYQFLIDRYVKSTTNNAVINNICKLIYGRGLSALDANKKPNEYAQLIQLIDKNVIRKLIFDRKGLGECHLQVIYAPGKKKIVKVDHFPAQLMRPQKCNKDGDIENYYYCDNWEEIKKHPPKLIPVFGTKNSELIEVLTVKPYSIGMKYFSLVDYQGSLPYATLEEEISDYLINEVQNGFSSTRIINFCNGVPSEEKQKAIVSKSEQKLTGSKGQKTIYSFNDNVENKTTIDEVALNDAPKHYEYLSVECREKIMLGHNVTSPLLFGIASTNGFSSNADELKNSSILFDNMVIQPYQEELIDAFNKILAHNGINLRLYFKTLQPLEFVDLTNAQTKDQVTKETGVEMSSHIDSIDLSNFGEEIDPEEWVLIDSRKVDYDCDHELDMQLQELNTPKNTLLRKILNLVSAGTARPNASSEQDGQIFKSRYRYSGDISDNSREFCRKMIGANKVYRKEDIQMMSNSVVNAGWGEHGADKYDIFLFKGGGGCNHYWTRETYLRKSDVNSPLAKQFTAAQARKAGEILPTNDKRVYQKPVDMPNNGFLHK